MAFEQRRRLPICARAIIRVHNAAHVEYDAIDRVISEHLTESSVRVEHMAFDADQKHADGGILHHIAEECLAVMETKDSSALVALLRLNHAQPR